MWICLRFLPFILSVSFLTAQAHGADLAGPYVQPFVSPCGNFNQDYATEVRPELLERAVGYFGEANTRVLGDQQVPISQLGFDWALETRDWCGVVVGDKKAGVWDNEAVNRCLCFYTYMNAY
ncbi:hypothetical protein E1162_02315 [Rhodobacteraceae bacterium RKSG542]|uniref:hypothetical protein n=1 Tax=Pseudovibrio flavus TaxID=2529854 RepID=UPI0012BD09E4|nr:hypothetical protein [Pseudovibrio flavus]MTI16069.1 hypothetical protein [Pseudovibrio flavus]